MIGDGSLRDRFATIAAPSEGADWDDVLRRARRSGRRRITGAAIVSVVAIAVVAPALGLQHTIVDWFEAEPAPEPVQLDFAQLGVGAPEGMDPGVIPNSARKVTVAQHAGRRHVLWVAPTREGGFCYLWTGLTGGCLKDRIEPSVPGLLAADLHPFLVGASWSPDESGIVQWVDGRVLAKGVGRLVAEYADGGRHEIPVVWVSPPIDAGFYVFWVPAEHRRVGHHLTAVAAESPEGEAIARQTFQLTPPELRQTAQRLPDGSIMRLPAKAVVEEARRLIDFRAENGSRQTLWVMPARNGGYCAASNRWSGCFPKDVSLPPVVTGVAGGETVLLQGQVRSDVAVIELRYQDGDVERIAPVEGFVLHEIPSRHHAPGHRLELEIAYDRDGRELGRHALPADSRGVYPCDEPVDQGYGVKMCP